MVLGRDSGWFFECACRLGLWNRVSHGAGASQRGVCHLLVVGNQLRRVVLFSQQAAVWRGASARLYAATTMSRRGQVMLSTVLILSGTILGATAIAGLLMLYQVRQSTNIGDSAKAIFAADAGLEYEFYRKYKDAGYIAPTLTNGASFATTLIGTTTVQSVGSAGEVVRAFEATFE